MDDKCAFRFNACHFVLYTVAEPPLMQFVIGFSRALIGNTCVTEGGWDEVVLNGRGILNQ